MSSWRRAAPLLVLLVLAVVLLARGRTGSEHAPGERPGATLQGTVTRVVDGDTIHVDLEGRDETVRYIGMDTPESVKPGTPVQCYAEAASHRNQGLVGGRKVTLHLDAETRDRYGRLLAYVYRRPDGMFVNAELVRQGYARTLTIPPNVAHAGEFARLADRARAAGTGLWRAC